ncbi:MAG: NO-inducible flavohemoprotein [Bryobacteraceae bacterium]
MLPHHRKTVQATVPVLREHGERITGVFYSQMCEAHPELLNIFNLANQRDGGQARSLAASILTYAAHIDRLDQLGGMVEQIAHKHVSLDILPEHYPIVGEHLLGAIKTVLGEAATPQILEAWAAAYEQLAEIMIGREKQLYDEAANQPGGWRGFKPFIVKQKQQESERITSFYLSPKDGMRLPPFKPGQYLAVKIQVPESEFEQIRQYSLSALPNGDYYRISVKRESAPDQAAPHGQISNYLHDHVKEGDTVFVHAPAGHFAINEGSDAPVVLISGGVGITPALCMLQHLAQQQRREVLFVHATTNRAHCAFREEVFTLTEKYPLVRSLIYYEHPEQTDPSTADYDHAGRISAKTLGQYLPAGDAEYYYCGPIGFMNLLTTILDALRVPLARRYSEAFAPDPSFDSEIARTSGETLTSA